MHPSEPILMQYGNHRIKDIVDSLLLALALELLHSDENLLVSIDIAQVQTVRYVEIYEKRFITFEES